MLQRKWLVDCGGMWATFLGVLLSYKGFGMTVFSWCQYLNIKCYLWPHHPCSVVFYGCALLVQIWNNLNFKKSFFKLSFCQEIPKFLHPESFGTCNFWLLEILIIDWLLCQIFCQIIWETFMYQLPDKDSLLSICFTSSKEPEGYLCGPVHVPSGKLLEPSCV